MKFYKMYNTFYSIFFLNCSNFHPSCFKVFELVIELFVWKLNIAGDFLINYLEVMGSEAIVCAFNTVVV